MPDLTNKILQEISDLTKNMDVLVRELKDARESQIDSTNSLKKLAENISKTNEDKTKKDEKNLSSDGELFKNFTESIQKSMENREKKFLDDFSKSFSLDLEKAFSNLPNQVAEVKEDKEASKNFTSDIVSQIAKKASEKTPGLEKGGEITKKGMAVVGEKGPELVELSRGDRIKTKEDQMLEMEIEELKRKERNKQVINSDLESFIQSEKQKLENKESVTNSFGVKVPLEQIEKEREILKKDPSVDVSEIEEEIKEFIESYRETMTLEDIQKLGLKETKINTENPIATKDPEKNREIKNKEKLEGITEPKIEKSKKIESKETLEESKKKDKGGFFSKSNEEFKKVSSETKKSFEAEKSRLSETFKPKGQKKEEQKGEMKMEKIRGDSMKLSDPVVKTQTDSQKQDQQLTQEKREEVSKEAPTIKPEGMKIQSPEKTSTEKSKKSSDKENSLQSKNENDIQEIKGLLAAIYKALTGPLTISSDIPFRPNSNHL
jgi:SLT domain-containing protein